MVRAARDRKLGCGGLMFEASSAWPVLGGQIVEVAPKTIGDKRRTAKVLLKAGTVTVKRPARGCGKTDPQTLTLTLVEAVEIDAPKGATPLLWRLITTLPATNLEEAMDAVRLYRLRWRIEQLFRTLKKDGLDLEATQHEEASRIMKLAALGVVASCRIMQLVDARDGGGRHAADVLAPQHIEVAAAISDSLEGATERQKNPGAKDRSPGWRGSRPVSAAGTAIMASLGPKPWRKGGAACKPCSKAPPSQWGGSNLFKSLSPMGEGVRRLQRRPFSRWEKDRMRGTSPHPINKSFPLPQRPHWTQSRDASIAGANHLYYFGDENARSQMDPGKPARF